MAGGLCSRVGCEEPKYSKTSTYCKVHQLGYVQAWRQANPDRVRAANKRNYRSEKAVSATRRWQIQHPEQVKAINAAYWRRHPEQVGAWKANNPAKARAWRIKYQYGITVEQAEALLAAQGGVCAICSRVPKRAVIDHDHKTETNRGILCDNCNFVLGHARDDISVLSAAIRYLRKSSKAKS